MATALRQFVRDENGRMRVSLTDTETGQPVQDATGYAAVKLSETGDMIPVNSSQSAPIDPTARAQRLQLDLPESRIPELTGSEGSSEGSGGGGMAQNFAQGFDSGMEDYQNSLEEKKTSGTDDKNYAPKGSNRAVYPGAYDPEVGIPDSEISGKTPNNNSHRPTPVSTGPLKDREQQAMAYYMSQGLTKNQAAGFVGNLVAESSLNTNARNRGDGSDGSDSIGIAQWNGGRARNLKAFASALGTSPEDFETQMSFTLHEMGIGERRAQTGGWGSESAAGKRLQSASTVDQGAAAGISFERPARWTAANPRNGLHWDRRFGHAQRLAGSSEAAPAPTPVAQGSQTPTDAQSAELGLSTSPKPNRPSKDFSRVALTAAGELDKNTLESAARGEPEAIQRVSQLTSSISQRIADDGAENVLTPNNYASLFSSNLESTKQKYKQFGPSILSAMTGSTKPSTTPTLSTVVAAKAPTTPIPEVTSSPLDLPSTSTKGGFAQVASSGSGLGYLDDDKDKQRFMTSRSFA